MAAFQFNTFPTLRTERLSLREIVPQDADDMMSILGDPLVVEYDTFPCFTERQQAVDLISWFSEEYRNGGSIFWGISMQGEEALLGFIKCEVEVPGVRADIGYDLRSSCWNRGIMTEAIGTVLDFVFKELKVGRVEAAASTRNPSSGKVLQKCGFTLEGVLRRRSMLQGEVHDMGMYSCLREERGRTGLERTDAS